MEETIEQYVTRMIEEGYTSKKGDPIKCVHCESKDLEFTPHKDDHVTVEIDVTCKSCGKPTGNWSYGNWGL